MKRVKQHLSAHHNVYKPYLELNQRITTAFGNSTNELLVRIFVRDARGRVVLLPTAGIIRLEAADDYVEVHANDKSYLMNITLNDFERRLDPRHFRRVHRSHIVNVNHIQLIETYNRRLLLSLADGSKIVASRAGTKDLRDLVRSN
jgi:two-component system LytT family response regulator